MCHSITVFILEMDLRLRLRLLPEPTQHFKPPSINFISAPISKLCGWFIDLFCTGGQCAGLFALVLSFYLATQKATDQTGPDTCTSMNKRANMQRWGRKDGKRLLSVIFPRGKRVWVSVLFSSRVHLSVGDRDKMQGAVSFVHPAVRWLFVLF